MPGNRLPTEHQFGVADHLRLVNRLAAGRDEGRKEAHCILPSPDNRNLYIPYVKSNNAILQYRFDPKSSKVEPLEPLDAQPPAGTGPRHIVYHMTIPLVHFSNEQHLGVSRFTIVILTGSRATGSMKTATSR